MSAGQSEIALMAASGQTTTTFEHPSPKQVLEVKDVLKQLRLPLEIIDVVIDLAEYWPCTVVSTGSETFFVGGSRNQDEFIARTVPLGYCDDVDGDCALHGTEYHKARPVAYLLTDSEEGRVETEGLHKKWASYSLPRTEHPCRKIVFTIRSHDQGWSSEPGQGTYQNSWTWFTAGLERVQARRGQMKHSSASASHLPSIYACDLRLGDGSLVFNLPTLLPLAVTESFEHGDESSDGTEDTNSDADASDSHAINPQHPPHYRFVHAMNGGNRLQSNVMAFRITTEHVITWSWDDHINPDSTEAEALEAIGRGANTGTGEFVRNLRLGDVVTLWAHARFPGWVNHVEFAKIEVYWVV